MNGYGARHPSTCTIIAAVVLACLCHEAWATATAMVRVSRAPLSKPFMEIGIDELNPSVVAAVFGIGSDLVAVGSTLFDADTGSWSFVWGFCR